VDQLLSRDRIVSWIGRTSREFVVAEIHNLFQEVREAIHSGASSTALDFSPGALELSLVERFQKRLRPNMKTVINGTGVILHTNLGRAPLSAAAQETLSAVSTHFTNLEYDLAEGGRSHRDKVLKDLLEEVLCCEAAAVVNNNAAAVFLILNTLAVGKEVVVSRGELIEIGGSFRIPDILARSGALLREVGTTNKTRVEDYLEAIGPNTALLLRVHQSNYRMLGFTERPDLQELVELSRKSRVPLAEDLGSGCLLDLKAYGIKGEPLVQESLSAGVDIVCFSADKLLGGPQAGIIAGSHKLVDPIRRNPLMRTYRVGKLIYGALEATLNCYRCGRAELDIPVLRMIAMSREELHRRAQAFSRKLRSRLPESVQLKVLEGSSVVGGGSCPECDLPTTLVAVRSDKHRPNTVESRLRLREPPIILRLEEDRIIVDLRTVFPSQEPLLVEGLSGVLLARPEAKSD